MLLSSSLEEKENKRTRKEKYHSVRIEESKEETRGPKGCNKNTYYFM